MASHQPVAYTFYLNDYSLCNVDVFNSSLENIKRWFGNNSGNNIHRCLHVNLPMSNIDSLVTVTFHLLNRNHGKNWAWNYRNLLDVKSGKGLFSGGW